jgi:Skp family chaperone for outer membrane proteins
MTHLQKKGQKIQKQIQDKKLEEAGNQLKALYEFVKFINEKCLLKRHERKTFWRNVSEGQPLVEKTLLDMLRKYGVKEESIKEIEQAKYRAQKQAEAQEVVAKREKEEQQKVNGKICAPDCSAECSECYHKPVKSEDTQRAEDYRNNMNGQI